MIKLFLRKILIRVLQPFGLYITYYASAGRIYTSLSKQPVMVQEYELNRIFDTIGIAKNHKFYNDLLANFTSNWKLDIQDAKFIGFGAGASSLSTFRKVKVNKKLLHEKIYFSSHDDVKRISWFYENVFNLVQKSGIALPNVHKIYSGEVLTPIYTEFVELIELDNTKKEDSLFQFSKQLYQLSLTDTFQVISDKAPKHIKDFKNHFEYKKNRSIAKDILNKNGISLEAIELNVIQSRYVLTHGDIQDTNAFQNNLLLDWDSVGVFPAGFDPAFLLFYLILKDEKEEEFNIPNWIDLHYKKSIKENEWKSFQISVLYFLFVFLQTRIRKEKLEFLNRELIQQLKKYT
jgi:hypothetical protein